MVDVACAIGVGPADGPGSGRPVPRPSAPPPAAPATARRRRRPRRLGVLCGRRAVDGRAASRSTISATGGFSLARSLTQRTTAPGPAPVHDLALVADAICSLVQPAATRATHRSRTTPAPSCRPSGLGNAARIAAARSAAAATDVPWVIAGSATTRRSAAAAAARHRPAVGGGCFLVCFLSLRGAIFFAGPGAIFFTGGVSAVAPRCRYFRRGLTCGDVDVFGTSGTPVQIFSLGVDLRKRPGRSVAGVASDVRSAVDGFGDDCRYPRLPFQDVAVVAPPPVRSLGRFDREPAGPLELAQVEVHRAGRPVPAVLRQGRTGRSGDHITAVRVGRQHRPQPDRRGTDRRVPDQVGGDHGERLAATDDQFAVVVASRAIIGSARLAFWPRARPVDQIGGLPNGLFQELNDRVRRADQDPLRLSKTHGLQFDRRRRSRPGVDCWCRARIGLRGRNPRRCQRSVIGPPPGPGTSRPTTGADPRRWGTRPARLRLAHDALLASTSQARPDLTARPATAASTIRRTSADRRTASAPPRS